MLAIKDCLRTVADFGGDGYPMWLSLFKVEEGFKEGGGLSRPKDDEGYIRQELEHVKRSIVTVMAMSLRFWMYNPRCCMRSLWGSSGIEIRTYTSQDDEFTVHELHTRRYVCLELLYHVWCFAVLLIFLEPVSTIWKVLRYYVEMKLTSASFSLGSSTAAHCKSQSATSVSDF